MPHSQTPDRRARWLPPALVVVSVSAVSLALGLGVVGPMIQRRMETPPPALAASATPTAAPLPSPPPATDVDITERPLPKPKPVALPAPTDSPTGTDAAPAEDGTTPDGKESANDGDTTRPTINATVTDTSPDASVDSSQAAAGAKGRRHPHHPAGDIYGPAAAGGGDGDTPAPSAGSGSVPKARSHRLSPLQALPPIDPDASGATDQGDKPDTVVPPDPGAAKGGRNYRVQVGHFENAQDAQRLRDELARSGLSPQVVTARRGGKIQYRVQVGTYRQKENADRQIEKLKSQSYDPYLADPEP